MQMRRALTSAAALLLVFSLSPTLNAQRDWIHLGDKHVDGHDDHDKISIGGSEGTFRQLQIRVREAAVTFNRVVVHFGKGADEEPQFRQTIRAGGQTGPLDFRGTDRVIKSVEFWYEKTRWREGRPTVELYGRR